MNDRIFIEAFEGPRGKAEVYELIEKAASGVENVSYEIVFNEQHQETRSMGEASVIACELVGDTRFLGAEQVQQ